MHRDVGRCRLRVFPLLLCLGFRPVPGIVWLLAAVFAAAAAGICPAADPPPLRWTNPQWEPFGFQDSNCSVVSFCSVGTVVYAGTSYGIYWRDLEPSRDRGWIAPSPQVALPLGNFPETLVRDPFTAGTLYAGIAPDVLTWGWAAGPTTGTVYLLKSTDSGATWSPWGKGLERNQICALATVAGRPGELMAGTMTELVCKSYDGGLTWPVRSRIHEFLTLAAYPTSASQVLASGISSLHGSLLIYESDDSGLTWHGTGSIRGGFAWALSLAPDPRDARTYYASDAMRVYKSVRIAGVYNASASDSVMGYVYAVAVHPGDSRTVMAAGRSSSTGGLAFAFSNDAIATMATWTTVAGPAAAGFGRSLLPDPANPNAVLVGTYGTGIYRVTFSGSPAYALYADADAGGTVTPSPNRTFLDPGTTVTLTAQAGPHATFEGWEGDVGPTTATATSMVNPLPLVMDRTRVLRAHFRLEKYAIRARSAPGGKVTRIPDQALYAWGSVVTLTAVPDSDKPFWHWTGDVPSGRDRENPLFLTVDTTRTLTAQFGPNRSNSWLVR